MGFIVSPLFDIRSASPRMNNTESKFNIECQGIRMGWQKILSQGVHSFVIALGDERKHLTSFILAAVVAGYLH